MKKKTIKNFLALSSLLLVPVMVAGCQNKGNVNPSINSSTSVGPNAFQGEGAPNNAIGNEGDTYTDTATGNVYTKQNGEWVLTTNHTPASYSGQGEPSNTLGNNGDTYTDTVNGAVYTKVNGQWVVTRPGDQTFTITFNLNGGHFADGSTTYPNQTVRDGYWIEAPTSDPIKEHCTFIGWFAQGSKEPWNFVGTAVRGNVNLIAQYEVNASDQIKVEVDPNNGEPSYIVETFVGDNLYPAIPTKPGYSFIGWYIERTDEKYNGVVTASLAGETLIAKWEVAKFNVSYQIEANDEITITGLLDIETVSIDIPNTIGGRKVTKISDKAFNSRIYLENIYIPANVKVVEEGAFRGTMRLVAIHVDSANVNYTAVEGALYTKDMKTLVCFPTKAGKTYTCPSTLTRIGDYAFYESKDNGISNVYFNEGLVEIGDYAFARNETIQNITFPSTLKKVGKAAFMGPTVSDDEGYYVSPQGVITNGSFNEGLEEIGEMAFANQYFKNTFSLPSSVKKIDDYAFANCNAIVKFIFPKSLEYFGKNVFAGATGILDLGIQDGNTHFKINDGILYTYDMKTLVMCPSGRTEPVTVPNGVTEIADYGFYMVDELQEYHFPSTLKKIGIEAFAHTYGLRSFEIPNSVTEMGKNCFDLSGISSITIGTGLTEIPEEAFIETKLSSVNIPGNVKVINDGAFSLCSKLNSLTLGEGVEDIKIGAFFKTGLKALNMPNSLKYIGPNAFSGASISALDIKDGLEEIGEGAFASNGTISIQKLSVSSGNKKFTTKDNILFSKDYKTVYLAASSAGVSEGDDIIINLPEGTETIYDYAFAHIKTVTKVNLPDSLVSIGEGAFYNTRFKDIKFGTNLKTIGEGAFASTSLATVTFNNKLEEIGDNAFVMSDIKKVEIPNSVKVVGEYAFSRCLYLEELVLGTGITTIKPFAFSDNRIYGTITIPASCTSIGEGAFSSTVSTYGQQLHAFKVDLANEYYSTDGKFLMNKAQTVIIATAGAHANAVTVPATVKEIANYGMACAGARMVFTSIALPSTLEKIGDYGMAFLAACRSLKVPASVKYCGEYAFAYWSNSQAITFEITRDEAYVKFNPKFLTSCNANVRFAESE